MALPIGLIYLFIFVNFIRGKGWPVAGAETRRERFRLSALAPKTRRLSIVSATLLGLTIASLALCTWLLTEWPSSQVDMIRTFLEATMWTILPLLWLAMIATGIIEEVAYRGYMQLPIEQRHGPVIAIAIVAVVFALSHSLPGIVVPIFVVGSLGWGILVYLTNSDAGHRGSRRRRSHNHDVVGLQCGNYGFNASL